MDQYSHVEWANACVIRSLTHSVQFPTIISACHPAAAVLVGIHESIILISALPRMRHAVFTNTVSHGGGAYERRQEGLVRDLAVHLNIKFGQDVEQIIIRHLSIKR